MSGYDYSMYCTVWLKKELIASYFNLFITKYHKSMKLVVRDVGRQTA